MRLKPSSTKPRKRRLSLAIAGFSNSGKTYTSLGIAHQLHSANIADKWCIVDTDNERSNLYSTVYRTEEWLDAIYVPNSDAANAELFLEIYENLMLSYQGIIWDSITPFWHGVRRYVTKRASKSNVDNPNEFAAWDGEGGGNDIFFRFLTDLCRPGGPVTIATIDMKEGYKYTQTTTASGKARTVIKKMGPTPIFRPGEHKYRFNFFAIVEKGAIYFDKATGSELEGNRYENTFPLKDGYASINKQGEVLIDGLTKWMNPTQTL